MPLFCFNQNRGAAMINVSHSMNGLFIVSRGHGQCKMDIYNHLKWNSNVEGLYLHHHIVGPLHSRRCWGLRGLEISCLKQFFVSCQNPLQNSYKLRRVCRGISCRWYPQEFFHITFQSRGNHDKLSIMKQNVAKKRASRKGWSKKAAWHVKDY